MSIDATRWAWQVQGVSPSQKLVLLSLADRAGEEHSCWPSIGRLVFDTGLNEKTIRKALHDMCEAGLISRMDTPGYTPVYTLNGVPGREHEPGYTPTQTGTPAKIGTPTKIGRGGYQNRQGGGTKIGRGGVPILVPEPIIEPVNEPIREPVHCSELSRTATEPPPETAEEAALPEPVDAVITLPLNTGAEHPVTAGEITQWAELYPAVEIIQELRNMRGWLLGNPKRRKTKNGIGRFIQAWLAKEQDKPRQRSHNDSGLSAREARSEELSEWYLALRREEEMQKKQEDRSGIFTAYN